MVLFKKDDEKITDLIYNIFNEKKIEEFLNPDYLSYRTRPKVRKWINGKVDNPVEVWYIVRSNKKYIGYVCYKWRKHYDESCEISTAIDKEYRGLKLGFESSKILIDDILSQRKFKYIAAYVHVDNLKAKNNLKKIGFKTANRLSKTLTVQFYDDDGTSETARKYNLLAIKTIGYQI